MMDIRLFIVDIIIIIKILWLQMIIINMIIIIMINIIIWATMTIILKIIFFMKIKVITINYKYQIDWFEVII